MSQQRFTEKTQEALGAAQRAAESRNHSQLEPEHLLLALLQQPDGVPARILRRRRSFGAAWSLSRQSRPVRQAASASSCVTSSH